MFRQTRRREPAPTLSHVKGTSVAACAEPEAGIVRARPKGPPNLTANDTGGVPTRCRGITWWMRRAWLTRASRPKGDLRLIALIAPPAAYIAPSGGNMHLRNLRPGFLALNALVAGALFTATIPAHAQLVIDGNLLYNNNATGTLAGQFVGVAGVGAPSCAAGTTAATIGTVTFTNNSYSDPLLPTAPYLPGVIPNFQPALGSPAYGSALTVPSGFFTQVCYKGAIGPNPGDDWTRGWTYWDSTGANRQDLHLAGMPNPRPLAVYDNVAIRSHQYFSADSNYLVRGQLRVKEQASLTVAPGVVIFEENSSLGTIIVERGGQLWAVANACEPIIVTSDDVPGSFTRGHCGGIVINGRAKTNLVNSCAGDSTAAEGGAIGYYGGNDDNDCSGALRYVRVEFSGRQITPNNELNTFTWCACGRNTRGDYLQAYQGADDSFEWFGGSMDQKYLLAIDGTDDGYDWQMGTRNRSQFVILRPANAYAPGNLQWGDKGIEADDNEFNYNEVQCSGRSNCTLANFTIVGDKRIGANFPGPAAGVNFRRGTGGTLINSIITNFKSGAFKIDDDATYEAHCVAAPAAPAVYCPGALGVNPITSGRVFVANSAPNPFRNQVAIHFTLPQASPVQVEIYSADGRLVKTLENGSELAAGTHTMTWDMDRGAAAGVYFYRVMAGSERATGKLVRIN
jgi:hypothetical protein